MWIRFCLSGMRYMPWTSAETKLATSDLLRAPFRSVTLQNIACVQRFQYTLSHSKRVYLRIIVVSESRIAVKYSQLIIRLIKYVLVPGMRYFKTTHVQGGWGGSNGGARPFICTTFPCSFDTSSHIRIDAGCNRTWPSHKWSLLVCLLLNGWTKQVAEIERETGFQLRLFSTKARKTGLTSSGYSLRRTPTDKYFTHPLRSAYRGRTTELHCAENKRADALSMCLLFSFATWRPWYNLRQIGARPSSPNCPNDCAWMRAKSTHNLPIIFYFWSSERENLSRADGTSPWAVHDLRDSECPPTVISRSPSYTNLEKAVPDLLKEFKCSEASLISALFVKQY
jgi:hypothetical protein